MPHRRPVPPRNSISLGPPPTHTHAHRPAHTQIRRPSISWINRPVHPRSPCTISSLGQMSSDATRELGTAISAHPLGPDLTTGCHCRRAYPSCSVFLPPSSSSSATSSDRGRTPPQQVSCKTFLFLHHMCLSRSNLANRWHWGHWSEGSTGALAKAGTGGFDRAQLRMEVGVRGDSTIL